MYRLLLLIGIFAAQSAWAQRFPSPPDNGLYRTDVVPRIDITIPADSLAAIFANVSSDYEYHLTIKAADKDMILLHVLKALHDNPDSISSRVMDLARENNIRYDFHSF
jgi:hypothetical protein